MVQSYLRGSSYVIPQRKDAAFFVGSHQKYWENSEELLFFTLLLIDNGDLLLNLKCFKLYLRKLHVIMPCSKGGGFCKMIFKSKYELYEFHLAPSPWRICRFQKKQMGKWAA